MYTSKDIFRYYRCKSAVTSRHMATKSFALANIFFRLSRHLLTNFTFFYFAIVLQKVSFFPLTLLRCWQFLRWDVQNFHFSCNFQMSYLIFDTLDIFLLNFILTLWRNSLCVLKKQILNCNLIFIVRNKTTYTFFFHTYSFMTEWN